MLYNKRGALTTRQIVILTVLIISFIIILFLIFRLNLGGTTKKEICHNSVLLAGKSLFPSVVPLDCHTEYICLSKTSKCDKTVDEVIEVKTKDDIYKTIADKMADCWWMFGEGRVNYVGGEAIPDFYCSICSDIVFDENIKEIFKGENLYEEGRIFTITQETQDYYPSEIYFRFKDKLWKWSIDRQNWEVTIKDYIEETVYGTESPLQDTSLKILKALDKVRNDEEKGFDILGVDSCFYESATCFSQKGIYDYIVSNEVSKGIPYDEYLYGVDFSNSKQILDLVTTGDSGEIDSIEFMNVNLDRPHIILMGMTSDVSMLGWVWRGAVAAIATIVVIKVTIVTLGAGSALIPAIVVALLASSKLIILSTVGGIVFGGIVSETIPGGLEYLKPIMIEKDSAYFGAIECDDVITFS